MNAGFREACFAPHESEALASAQVGEVNVLATDGGFREACFAPHESEALASAQVDVRFDSLPVKGEG